MVKTRLPLPSEMPELAFMVRLWPLARLIPPRLKPGSASTADEKLLMLVRSFVTSV